MKRRENGVLTDARMKNETERVGELSSLHEFVMNSPLDVQMASESVYSLNNRASLRSSTYITGRKMVKLYMDYGLYG